MYRLTCLKEFGFLYGKIPNAIKVAKSSKKSRKENL